MTVELGWWLIPVIITVAGLLYIITPIKDDVYGIGTVIKMLVLIPVLLSWVIYLAIF